MPTRGRCSSRLGPACPRACRLVVHTGCKGGCSSTPPSPPRQQHQCSRDSGAGPAEAGAHWAHPGRARQGCQAWSGCGCACAARAARGPICGQGWWPGHPCLPACCRLPCPRRSVTTGILQHGRRAVRPQACLPGTPAEACVLACPLRSYPASARTRAMSWGLDGRSDRGGQAARVGVQAWVIYIRICHEAGSACITISPCSRPYLSSQLRVPAHSQHRHLHRSAEADSPCNRSAVTCQ